MPVGNTQVAWQQAAVWMWAANSSRSCLGTLAEQHLETLGPIGHSEPSHLEGGNDWFLGKLSMGAAPSFGSSEVRAPRVRFRQFCSLPYHEKTALL